MEKLFFTLGLFAALLTGIRPAMASFVTLGAPAVEISWALGERPMARSSWDTWPPGEIPNIGNAAEPNMELLVTMRPDFVLADGHYSSLARKLAPFGIEVEWVNAFNRPEVIPTVRQLGQRFGREAEARKLEAALTQVDQMVAERVATLRPEDRPVVVMLAGPPYFSFSSASGRTLLEDSGARNLCDLLPNSPPYPTLALEWLVQQKPDFVLIAPDMLAAKAQAPVGQNPLKSLAQREAAGPLGHIPCVRAGKLLVLDDRLSYGLRASFGTLYLAKTLHPQLFADLDVDALYAHFLREFFDLALTGEELERVIYP